MPVNVRVCDLYKETVAKYPQLAPKVADFIRAKNENPTAPFGGSDTHFVGEGPIGRLGLKIKHAHLSQDVSIIYRLHGNPTMLDLYGLFSHKESGTGNNPNVKIQKSLAKRFANQDF